MQQSGYQPELFPVYHLTRQPPPADDPDARQRPSMEPIYTTTTFWARTRAEYLTFWYVGRIAEDAVRHDKRKMLDGNTDAVLFRFRKTRSSHQVSWITRRICSHTKKRWHEYGGSRRQSWSMHGPYTFTHWE